MARHEHDYRDADDYAEEFIRAIMLVRETSKPAGSGERAHDTTATKPIAARAQPSRHQLPPDIIRLKETGGIWHVTVADTFWGDFHRKEQALAAMARAKLSLR